MRRPKPGDYDYEAFLDQHPIERVPSLEEYYADTKNRNYALEREDILYRRMLIQANKAIENQKP